MEKKEILIKELEHENTALRGCIESVLARVSGGYDGYNDVEGLKHLIDGIEKILESGYPERIVNYVEREVCPLCFEEDTMSSKSSGYFKKEKD